MPFVLLISLIFATPMPTESFAARIQDSSPVTSVTIAAGAQGAEGPFAVAIRLTVAPDWYLYWTNPGDAGLPLAVRWNLPAGFRTGELSFPTPEKIVHDEIIAYGYYRELIVLCTLTPPPGYRHAEGDTVHADLSWLVCSESCIPGRASVALPLGTPSAATPAAAELVARFARQQPRAVTELGLEVGPLAVTRAGGELLVHIPLSAPVDDFYPETIEDCVIDHKRIIADGSGVTIPVTPFDSSTIVTSVRGLAIVNGTGYRLEAALRQ